MAKNHKWLQMDEFLSLKADEGFPNESSLGPHPHQGPKYCPIVDTLSVALHGRGRIGLPGRGEADFSSQSLLGSGN